MPRNRSELDEYDELDDRKAARAARRAERAEQARRERQATTEQLKRELKPRSDAEEIAYLVVVLIGIAAIARVWTTRIRPWLNDTWTELHTGHTVVHLPVMGSLDRTDLIGLAVLVVPFVVLILVLSSLARRRRVRRRDR